MERQCVRKAIPWIALLLVASSVSVSAEAEGTSWAVQTSSALCVFLPNDAEGAIPLATVERTLSEITTYWGSELGPLVGPDDSGTPAPFLCSLFVYPDRETMWRDLDRFDVGGMTVSHAAWEDRWMLRIPMRDRLPESVAAMCGAAWAVAFVDGHPDGGWVRTTVHELTHALQSGPWPFGSGLTTAESHLLWEGVAEWTTYALGYAGDDFNHDVQGLVAFWLQSGGDVGSIPFYLRTAVGTSLVERCCRLRDAPTFWAMCTAAQTTSLHVADTVDVTVHWPFDFHGTCRTAYGAEWDDLTSSWATEVRSMSVCADTEHRIRWLRDAFALRLALLRPLLSETTRAELESLSALAGEGAASSVDLDRAEGLLRRAPEEGLTIDVDALTARESTLKRYALLVDGARSDVVNVLRLGMLARRGVSNPREYASAFASAVNAYVPAAVRLPW
jgi:hypothetical protein